MSKAGGAREAGRDARLASALRDNLRRRKASSRPAGEAAGELPADGRAKATPADKSPEGAGDK